MAARIWDPQSKKWVARPKTATGGVVASIPRPRVVDTEAAGEQAFGETYDTTPTPTAQSNAGLDWLNTGGGGTSRSTAASRGFEAAGILGRQGTRASQLYGQRAEQQAAAMRGMYEPMFVQQEQALRGLPEQSMAAYNPYFQQAEAGIEAQRKAALEALSQQYAGNVGTIDAATQAALAGIPAAQAYSNVPIVELQAQANPLLASIQGFGADPAMVEAQRAQDALLAGQLAQMARGSATQLNQAQQAMRDAAMGDININKSRALQQLALQQMALQGAIGSQAQGALSGLAGERAQLGAGFAAEQARALADLAQRRATADVGVEEMRQSLLNQGLQELLAGRGAAAQQRAKTVADVGRPRRKSNRGGKK